MAEMLTQLAGMELPLQEEKRLGAEGSSSGEREMSWAMVWRPGGWHVYASWEWEGSKKMEMKKERKSGCREFPRPL